MTPLHRVLQILSVAGVVAFLLVRVEKAEANGERTERLTVGLPFSPWLVDERVDLPRGGFKIHREMTFLSWSWLCLIPAFVFTYREGRAGSRESPREHHDHAAAPQADLRDPR